MSSSIITKSKSGVLMLGLNRLKALNALDLDMVRIMTKQIKENKSSKVLLYGLHDPEKPKHASFCSGGDIVKVAHDAYARRALLADDNATVTTEGSDDVSKVFFAEEYMLDYLISDHDKPTVAVMDGITMGGGVGLSINCEYRIATPKSMFAMPEAGIGFFCDVGGSYFLPRLPGKMGHFLALTGERLFGNQLVEAGVASHYVEEVDVDEVAELLIKHNDEIDLSRQFDAISKPITGEYISSVMPTVNKLYDAETLEEIFHNVEEAKETHPIAAKSWNALQKASPLSLRIVFEQLKRGKTHKDLRETFKMEYNISQHMMERGDFCEGVRALLIDRDNNPKWQHENISQVSEDEVNSYFEKYSKGHKLSFK